MFLRRPSDAINTSRQVVFPVDGSPIRRGTPIGTSFSEILLKCADVITQPTVIINDDVFKPKVLPYCKTDSSALD